MINDWEMILRLALAAFLAACVGFEREKRGQTAGLRTHTILSVGAALAMYLSIMLAVPNYDPARIAAQVVSGIGFLGAGAILRYGANVKGLTTATSLWTVAIIGLATGAGYYVAAVMTTVLLLVVLVGLDWVEHRFIHSTTIFTVVVSANDRAGLLRDLKRGILQAGRSIISTHIARNIAKDITTLTFVVKTTSEDQTEQLVSDLSAIKGIKQVEVS